MLNLLVYAAIDSRLEADVLIVRLKNAGVPTESVSVLFPSCLRPNSALCWLKESASFVLNSGEDVSAAGFLAGRLDEDALHRGPGLVGALARIGFDHEQAVRVEETLRENQLVVAVDAARELDLPAIFHVLRSYAAETVHTRDQCSPASAPVRRARKSAGVAPALALAPAV